MFKCKSEKGTQKNKQKNTTMFTKLTKRKCNNDAISGLNTRKLIKNKK